MIIIYCSFIIGFVVLNILNNLHQKNVIHAIKKQYDIKRIGNKVYIKHGYVSTFIHGADYKWYMAYNQAYNK